MASTTDSRPPLSYNPAVLPRELKEYYISASQEDIEAMLKTIGIGSLDDLFSHISDEVKFREPLDLPDAQGYEELQETLSYWLEPLAKHTHALSTGKAKFTCELCGSTLAEMSSDLLAVEGLKLRVIESLRGLIPLPDKVERIRLIKVAGEGLTLASREDIDMFIEELRAHLYKLIDAETKVILE